MEYACTGTEHPCGCYTLLKKDRARVAELEKFIEGTAERNEELRAQVAELRGALRKIIDEKPASVARHQHIARAILAKTLPTDDWHDPFYVKLRRGK